MKVKVSLLILSISTLALGSCRPNTPKPKPEPDEPFSFERLDYELKEGVSEDELQGAPWINSNLPGMTAKVEKPSLKDDFYASVNYEKLCDNEPGPFDISSDNVRNQLNTIIYQDSAAANSKFICKAKNLLNLGAIPQVQYLINSININSYITSVDQFKTVGSFFSLQSDGNNRYILNYNDGYFQNEPGFASFEFYGLWYDDYLNMGNAIVTSLANTFGISMSESTLDAVNAFDQNISQEIYSEAYYNGVSYSTYTLSELSGTEFSGFASGLASLGLTAESIIKISNLTYLGFTRLKEQMVTNSAIVRNTAIARAIFDYRYLAGLDGYRAISANLENSRLFPNDVNVSYMNAEAASYYMLHAFIPDLIQKSYTELYASSEIKQQVADLIEDVLDGYLELAETIDWIGDATRYGLKRKLNYMTYTSCYSDFINNYPVIDETGIDSFDLVDIHNKYYGMELQAIINNAHEDDVYWQYMPAFTVNAFYDPSSNSFVILNGLLSGGFLGDSIEETYGKLGVVIGHEISHGFDENGANYDEYGQERNWWNSEDKKTFKRKVKAVKRFFDQINLYDDLYVDGDTVNTEATADMGGVRVMLTLAKKINNFDYDKFFRAYANLWLERAYDDYTIERMLTNEHPYAYQRVNVTLAQFEEFVKTYNIKSGDGMYVPKDERIAVW